VWIDAVGGISVSTDPVRIAVLLFQEAGDPLDLMKTGGTFCSD
jgi:hypothetical protein